MEKPQVLVKRGDLKGQIGTVIKPGNVLHKLVVQFSEHYPGDKENDAFTVVFERMMDTSDLEVISYHIPEEAKEAVLDAIKAVEKASKKIWKAQEAANQYRPFSTNRYLSRSLQQATWTRDSLLSALQWELNE